MLQKKKNFFFLHSCACSAAASQRSNIKVHVRDCQILNYTSIVVHTSICAVVMHVHTIRSMLVNIFCIFTWSLYRQFRRIRGNGHGLTEHLRGSGDCQANRELEVHLHSALH